MEGRRVAKSLKDYVAEGKFDPVEYMRNTRPHLFSDTQKSATPVLEKGYLEYHLGTLTSKNQEHAFEEFSRRLAELEICPNLRPQTGPTGGGDSKTDSSTYPVADDLALRAYWGTPTQATSQNWAFAFSCKAKWKPKVESDIAKIAKLERKFKKAYFISNQFIRDKERGELEQSLSKKYGFEVHLLDRNWIVECVLNHGREQLAIECLGISPGSREKTALGPRDTARSQELAQLLDRLSKPLEFYADDYSLASAYRRAALLSRGLEKPRHEVEGLFQRARELSRKFGNAKQIISIAYDHAWTLLWWYDEPIQVAQIYAEIEQLLPKVEDAEDCDNLHNLLTLLLAAFRMNRLTSTEAALKTRLATLRDKLEKLATDQQRPNNALHAETVLWFTRFDVAFNTKKFDLDELPPEKSQQAEDLLPGDHYTLEAVCEGLLSCLNRAGGLTTYPTVSFIETIRDVGELIDFPEPAYDKLFQRACEITRERSGERAEGDMLLARGLQLVDHEQYQEALIALGNARCNLAKEESLYDSCRAALACSDVYTHMGLFWAARMEAIIAAVLALRQVDGKPLDPFLALLATKRLCYCELNLARIAPFLAWLQFCGALLELLDPDSYHVDKLAHDLLQLELSLGSFFLNLNEDDAREISNLTPALGQMGLHAANDALRYSIGEKEKVATELAESQKIEVRAAHEMYSRWRDQMPPEVVRRELAGETRSHWRMETTLLGVKYKVTCQNSFGPILFAENLLGVLEAMLALARWDHLAFLVDEVAFQVSEERVGKSPPFLLDLNGNWQPTDDHELRFAPNLVDWMLNKRREFCEWLHRFTLKVIYDGTIDPLEDITAEFDRLGQNGTFARALSTSPTSIAVNELVGKKKYDLNYWYEATDSLPIQRSRSDGTDS
jgi:hypothetical protein